MSNWFTVFDCYMISFPKIATDAGTSTLLQTGNEIPFDIKRIFYLYDVPGGESRGAHAHKTLEQILIAASGSFDVTMDDSKTKKTVTLNRPYMGLHIKPGIWKDISNFSSGVICLVLASDLYNEAEYIRYYNEFLDFKQK